ncbi:MAG TPA: tetratricopeptide repeat protein, partial [Roseiflexaceae bacterium]
EALPSFEASLAMRQRVFPQDHPEVAATLISLANCLDGLGRSEESLPKYEAALAMQQRLSPGDDPVVADSLFKVAYCRQGLGHPEEALPLYQAAWQMEARLHPGDHANAARDLYHLGRCARALGRMDDALAHHQAALQMRQRLFGDHPDVVTSLNAVAQCQTSLGRPDEAEPLLSQAVQICRRIYTEPDGQTALVLHHDALALWSLERLDEALPLAREAAEMYRDHSNWSPHEEIHALGVLGGILFVKGEYAEATEGARRCLDVQRRLHPPGHVELGHTLANLGLLLLRLDTLDAAREAEPLLRECLEIRSRTMPAAWQVDDTKSLLGGALLAIADKDGALLPAARVDELKQAEPLILEAYAGLKDNPNLPPVSRGAIDRTCETLVRIVRLYELWDELEPGSGYAGKAAEWRAKLESGGAGSAEPAPPARASDQ